MGLAPLLVDAARKVAKRAGGDVYFTARWNTAYGNALRENTGGDVSKAATSDAPPSRTSSTQPPAPTPARASPWANEPVDTAASAARGRVVVGWARTGIAELVVSTETTITGVKCGNSAESSLSHKARMPVDLHSDS
ncbi:hypothetical protein BX283_7648 [Streptomyces sp. TLI_146]|nr:hypothetical protein BX283_7648 [Streptomyces sp. TLI_146]